MQTIIKTDLIELLAEMQNTVDCIHAYGGWETTPFRLIATADNKLAMYHDYYGHFDFDTFSEAIGILIGFQNVFMKHGHSINKGVNHG